MGWDVSRARRALALVLRQGELAREEEEISKMVRESEKCQIDEKKNNEEIPVRKIMIIEACHYII